MTDLGAEHPVRVMGLPKLYGLVRFAQPQIRLRESPVDCLLTDLRVFVLRQQQPGLLQKLQRAAKQGLVPAFKTKRAVQRGAGVDDLKGVRILLECLFRLRKPVPILAAAVFLQAFHRRLQTVVLDFIAQQHVHRGIEKICHLDD